MDAPACTCERPTGAHDERCAYIKHVRSSAYDPGDMAPPAFLVRVRQVKPTGGVFD